MFSLTIKYFLNSTQKLENEISNYWVLFNRARTTLWTPCTGFCLYQTAVRTRLEPRVGISLAWEWATTTDRHCTHCSAFFPFLGFRMRESSPVKISNALGMLRAPRLTLTLRMQCTSIGVSCLSSFWNNR